MRAQGAPEAWRHGEMEVIREGARVAAREAAAAGIHWTFAPMVDIARDPRWGRIAEGGGEDPYLAACLGAAMVEGLQGKDLADPERIAACAKHYVGYGAAEGGRDYNTTWIPEGLLRDVYLVPFQACVQAGVATLMSAFNDLNGVPASGNAFTLRKILLSYTTFAYRDLALSTQELRLGETLTAAATVTNTGKLRGIEVVQLYVRDLVGSLTRPVRELKGFQRIELEPGESRRVRFSLHSEDLAFHNADMRRVTEPGRFRLWIGSDAQSGLEAEFDVAE